MASANIDISFCFNRYGFWQGILSAKSKHSAFGYREHLHPILQKGKQAGGVLMGEKRRRKEAKTHGGGGPGSTH